VPAGGFLGGGAFDADMEFMVDNPTRDNVWDEYGVVIHFPCQVGRMSSQRGLL
jgi:hypothetical protein